MIFADGKTKKVLAVAQHKGSTHDFALFKEAFDGAVDKIQFLADSGFQGILKFHANSLIPIKRSKNHELSDVERKHNHELSRRRIAIEHVNAWVKIFKIMSYRYRNKRRRHGLRIALICGIYNMEMS